MSNAADIVFLILFGSAAFTVVDRTGALATGILIFVVLEDGRIVDLVGVAMMGAHIALAIELQ